MTQPKSLRLQSDHFLTGLFGMEFFGALCAPLVAMGVFDPVAADSS